MRKTSYFYAVLYAAIIVLAGCATQEEKPQPYLVLYAFETEGELLAERMAIRDSAALLGRMVYVGDLSGQDIVLAESGVGMNNAAMTTQQMIDLYSPCAVIFTGIAGAIDTAVEIGDIVVCTTWFQHDYGYYGKEGFQPTAQEIFSRAVDSITWMAGYDVDSSLFATAERMADLDIDFEPIGDRKPQLHFGGIGVTGNAFIDNRDKRIWLNEKFEGMITDMESSAVAHICTANDIPFIIFRSASDLAGGSGSDTAGDELERFFEVAADNSSRMVMKFLSVL